MRHSREWDGTGADKRPERVQGVDSRESSFGRCQAVLKGGDTLAGKYISHRDLASLPGLRLLRPAPVDRQVVDSDHRIRDALRGAVVMDGGSASFEEVVIDDRKTAD